MGNCMHAAADAKSTISVNPSNHTRPSTTGTSVSTSNGVGNSATSSSAGHSRFWDDASPWASEALGLFTRVRWRKIQCCPPSTVPE